MTFDIKHILAENLVRLMHHDDAHPITQAELARRSKVDQRYIGRLLNAEFNASVKVRLEPLREAAQAGEQPAQQETQHQDQHHQGRQCRQGQLEQEHHH